MRKVLALIAILTLLLASCQPTETPEPAPPTGGDEHDLGGADVRIAVENAYPPFNFIDEDTNEPVGWDFDACRAICEVLNCTPVFVEAAWEGIFEATAAGEYDMVADGVTITDERDEIVDFSDPYMVIAQYIVVGADETEITDEASLIASDAMVGTQIGTTNEAKAIELVGEARVQSFDTFDLPITALMAGDVDAVIMDEEAARGFVEQNPDDIMLLTDAVTGAEELGFVFPPGSDLVEPVNYALGVLEADGTLDTIYETWWGEEEATDDGFDLGGADVRIAVENAYPPFNFIDEDTNEMVGWDYDACRAICEVLNCTPVFVEAAWEGIFEATAAGEYDMVADGVTITDERDEIVDFSDPYMVIAQYVVVRADEADITDEASLIASDAIVGTQIGTTNEAKAIELVGEARVQSFDTFDLPIQALISGDVRAVLMDEEAARGFVEQNPDDIMILADPVTGAEELGFVFPPGSDLVEPVNYALEMLEADGTLDAIYDTWWAEEEYDLGGADVRIAVENAYPPFNFIDEDTNEMVGWDYDACRAICEVINCTPVFVEAAWEGIFEATAAGEYDMVADGVTITPERDEIVDFSDAYMVIAQYIVVRADEADITDEATLVSSDGLVGTQIGTTNEAKAIELVGEARVQSFDTFDLPIQALISGDVRAVIMDEEAARGFVEQNPDDIMLLADAVTGAEELGFVFPSGSDLVDAVNYALGMMEADGTLDAIYDTWWGEE